jgi:hypothetical protein
LQTLSIPPETDVRTRFGQARFFIDIRVGICRYLASKSDLYLIGRQRCRSEQYHWTRIFSEPIITLPATQPQDSRFDGGSWPVKNDEDRLGPLSVPKSGSNGYASLFRPAFLLASRCSQ